MSWGGVGIGTPTDLDAPTWLEVNFQQREGRRPAAKRLTATKRATLRSRRGRLARKG